MGRREPEHIALHGLLPDDVAEAYNGETLELETYLLHGETRFHALGTTLRGRILFLVSVVRGDLIRVVTAFDVTPAQKRQLHEHYRSLYE